MDFIKSIFFGIVEGVTEWLPVSSTGHMILLQEFIKMDVSDAFWNLYLVVIQFGAILAVILLFWNRIWPLKWAKDGNRRKLEWKMGTLQLWLKVIIACVPAAIVGVLADDLIDKYLYKWYVVAIMLIVVGAAFILIENYNQDLKPSTTRLKDLTGGQALVVGLFQLVAAILPGTSRSGATILGGIAIGISRTVAAEFTFILAIPVMAGASLLKFAKYDGSLTGREWGILLIGMAVAFFVSVAIIKFLMNYIRKHDFKVFGWYRIALGVVVLAFFGIRAIVG
ncbi:MAG: undecaprenyl-diphosphate phosphatase [Lachnospiraceae bacterium]|jgi:undecaprenyl-diphosphatase|nr:undecaprenyl-diphosphate phosphatase [Lachnospiraceae bacterium]MDY6334527.1 undecaprenyl-diphosphate phosphatase [Lachnospiraceae bacterium]